MLFAESKAAPRVEVEFTDMGHDPAYFSHRAVEAIVINAGRENYPAHVFAQVQARKNQLRDIIHHWIERAINSDRHLTEIKLRAMGCADAADWLKSERITK